jgi:hypothetical protein
MVGHKKWSKPCDDCDDVLNVRANFDIPDDILACGQDHSPIFLP